MTAAEFPLSEEERIILVMEVLRLKLQGAPIKQIASRTGIHYRTVARIVQVTASYVKRRRTLMSKNLLGETPAPAVK